MCSQTAWQLAFGTAESMLQFTYSFTQLCELVQQTQNLYMASPTP